MNLDISVAPEIALLAAAGDSTTAAPPGPAVPPRPATAAPPTVGYLARCVRLLVADPQGWWDLVRFDPLQPVHVRLPAPGPGCEAWLLVLPPRQRGDGRQPQWRWDVAYLVAGAMAGRADPAAARQIRPLRSGRLRVRGRQEPHHLVNTGNGHAVSLHARPAIRREAGAAASAPAPPQRYEDGLGLPAGSGVPVWPGEACGLDVGECGDPTGPGDVGEAVGRVGDALGDVGDGLARRVVGEGVGVGVGVGDDTGVLSDPDDPDDVDGGRTSR